MLYTQAPRFSAPLAFKSFRPRALRTCPCNFFVFCQFRTLPFSVHFFFHRNLILSNSLRTLLQKWGVGTNSSQNGTLAIPSLNHESRLTPLQCAVPKNRGWWVLFSASGGGCGPREVQRRGASQILLLRFPVPFTTNENTHPVLRSSPAHQTASPVVFLSASVPSAHRPEFPPRASAPPARGGNSGRWAEGTLDRKSTRLNSSHLGISYAVFRL